MTTSSSRFFWMPRRPVREESAVAATALAAGLFGVAVMTSDPPEDEKVEATADLVEPNRLPDEEAAKVAAADRALRNLVIGRWKGYFHGNRVVENRPDGTASMDLAFDFVASLLYGPKMSLEMTWEVKDGALCYELVSGLPEDKYKKLVDKEGDEAAYYFEEAGPKVMRLVRTIDPDEKYTWTRIELGGK